MFRILFTAREVIWADMALSSVWGAVTLKLV